MIVQKTKELLVSFSIQYQLSVFLGYEITSLGEVVPKFQGNIIDASSRVEMSKKNSAQQVDVCIYRDGVPSSPTSSWTFQHVKMDHYTVSKCWVPITF
jgi:hypothetical protein